ncbi:hypothetical protein Bbelb_403220 [Branchiostoma belcheri]|nr:hypothetical protein Bbelb_403220 [Branchiostoma belcheri]
MLVFITAIIIVPFKRLDAITVISDDNVLHNRLYFKQAGYVRLRAPIVLHNGPSPPKATPTGKSSQWGDYYSLLSIIPKSISNLHTRAINRTIENAISNRPLSGMRVDDNLARNKDNSRLKQEDNPHSARSARVGEAVSPSAHRNSN